MSLNYKEIDCVLKEIDCEGAFIQGIVQTAYDTLILELYKNGRAFKLFICLTPGTCRIHELNRAVKKSEKPLRFTEFLKANIKGFQIQSCKQIYEERIIQFVLTTYAEKYFLFVKLWSNAANIILTDSAFTILDASARRPKRGEVKNGIFNPEASILLSKNENVEAEVKKVKKEFAVRDFPGTGSFQERMAKFYDEHEGALSLEALREKTVQLFEQKKKRQGNLIDKLTHKITEYENAEKLKEAGDLLLANLHQTISKKDSFIEVDDFFKFGEKRKIELIPNENLKQNAEHYYEKYKKAKNSLVLILREKEEQEQNFLNLQKEEARLLALQDPLNLVRALRKEVSSSKQTEKKSSGVAFMSHDFIIRVGRSALENDELLRHFVKGQDLWLHTRDVPGGYVFIKAKAKKTIPLEVLIDAGNLAVFYSKARKTGEADLYYTQVKHLRRVKGGPKGLVLPANEKNLHIKMKEEIIHRLKPLSI